MKHQQSADVPEYRTSSHPMASSEWARVWSLPIFLASFLGFAGCISLTIYALTHWNEAAQWVEVIAFALGVLLTLRLYFYFHGKYHHKRMHDIAAREREIDLRLKRAHANLLEEATANRANVRLHETGAVEVQYSLAPVRVSEVQQKQIAAPQLPPSTTIIPVPTGRELLLSGKVQHALSQGLIILGPGADGNLKTLKIKKCFSTLVSGLPSSGKTTTVFWIAGQLVLIGAKLWIVDPHMHFEDEEGNKSLASELEALAESFVFSPCDGEPSQVIQRVQWMYAELLRRQRPGYIVRADQTVIAIMDEFNTIADSIDPKQVIIEHNGRKLNFSSTLALLEREGRKYGLHFILIGHKWTQRDIGGDNALRTNATTYMCHRMNDKHQAELLISGGSKEVLALNAGSYWITGISWNSEPARITTPLISAADIPLLLQMMQRGHVEVLHLENVIETDLVPDQSNTTSATASTSRPPVSSEYESGRDTKPPGRLVDATNAKCELPAHLQVKMRQVLLMDEQGDKNQNDIISVVWGVTPDSRQGRAAKDELKQIRAYLANKYLTM